MNRMIPRSTYVLAALVFALASVGCKNKLVGLAASITVTPDNLAFGHGTVGTRQQIRVNVSNGGSAPLEVTDVKVASDPNHELALFEVLATDCNDQARSGGDTLAPGECARFSVTWTPTGSHAAAGSVEVDSNDLVNPVITLPVSGTATSSQLQYCVLTGADDGGTVDPTDCSNLAANPPVEPPIDFGAGVLSAASTRTVRLTNTGQAPLVFSVAPALSAATSTDFALTGSVPSNTLAPGATADLTITATPSTTGTLTGALLLSSNDPYVPSLSVPIQIAVAAAPEISVTPASLAFAATSIGTAEQIRVSVSNIGTAPLLLTGITVASDPNNELKVQDLLTTDCTDAARAGGSTLNPGQCARFTVVWTPTANHAATGSVEIDSNDPIHPAVTLPVTGANAVSSLLQLCVLTSAGTVDPTACTSLGTAPPVIPTIDFGTQTLGTPVTRTVRLISQGTAALTFSPAPAIATGGSAFTLSGSVPGNTLAPNATADLTITASPTVTGTTAGTLAVDSNDLFVPQLSVPIRISVSAFPIISVTPTTLAFGSTAIGTPQQIRVSVSNIGTAPLVLSNVKIASDPNSELSLDDVLTTDCSNNSRTGGTTLNPGDCARFTVVWSPLANHAAAGEVEIDSNDPSTPTVLLPVSGNAVTALLQICVLTSTGAVNPTQCSSLSSTPHVIPTIDFGSVAPDETTSLQVQLTNQGNTALTFSPAPALASTSASAYSLGGSVPGNSLAAGASATLTVNADATTAGTWTGALNVDSNDPRAPTIAVPITMTVPGWNLCAGATGVAFGAVSIGQTATQTTTFTNCGSSPLTVNSFAYAGISPTTNQFAVTGMPAPGSTIGVGAVITLGISYAPTVVRNDAGAVSYVVEFGGATLSGSLSIMGTGALAGCGTTGRPNPVPKVTTSYSTNGGSTYTVFNPATTPSPVIPLDWIKLDATGSTVSQGTASYTWTLISQPNGSTTALSSSTNTTTTMQTLVSGDYVVQLVVKDSTGCSSAAAAGTVTIQVVPQGAIHIELTWAEGCGDLDLHYVAPDPSNYVSSETVADDICNGNDIFWADLPVQYDGPGFPDWGCAAGQSCNGAPSNPGGPNKDRTTSDDATLDIDNVTGFGPENVTQKTPFASPSGAPYQVWVYYFSNHVHDGTGLPPCGTTHPTVNIYVDGALIQSYVYSDSPGSPLAQYYDDASFTQGTIWYAGNIAVASNRTTISVSQPPISEQLWEDSGDICACEAPGTNNGRPNCY